MIIRTVFWFSSFGKINYEFSRDEYKEWSSNWSRTGFLLIWSNSVDTGPRQTNVKLKYIVFFIRTPVLKELSKRTKIFWIHIMLPKKFVFAILERKGATESQSLNSNITRGFNGSVNFSENCDFRSQFDPFYIIS